MAVGFSNTNKPLNPRGQDASPKGYNRASLFSGKALDFDGVNDYVSVADSDDLDGFTDFTLHAIVKADTFPNYCRIFDKDHTTAYNLAVNTNNELYMYAKNTAFSFDYVVPTGEYVSIVVAFTGGSKADLFINGQLEETIATSLASISSNSSGLYIGRLYSGAGSPWDGQISSPRIFDVALTAAQVADLYNNPEKVVPTGLESNLKLWLPMMEGAGTTAYDGSGNGNHGTIAGATYVNGVGAPSPQSAVMDWNKAKNDIGRSQEFDNAYWGKGNLSVTANATTAPDGTTTADKLAATATTGGLNAEIYNLIGFYDNDSASVFVKSDTAQWVTLGTNRILGHLVFFDIINGVVGTESTGYTGAITEYPNGWYKLDVYWDGTASVHQYWDLSIGDADNSTGVTAGKSVFAWGAYANKSGTTIGPYVRTGATAQTSEVLLPQGLTTGRDITGVNLFENVRKQGALNLDGNSWAEVHDNESLDMGSGSWSAECWVYWDGTSNGDGIISRWYSTERAMLFFTQSGSYFRLFIGRTNGSDDYDISSSTISVGWRHLVGTYDSSDTKLRIYIDGALDVTSSAVANAYNSNAQSLEIGRFNNSTTGTYTNSIAQPRIYNRALTASEVLQNYNSGKNTYK